MRRRRGERRRRLQLLRLCERVQSLQQVRQDALPLLDAEILQAARQHRDIRQRGLRDRPAEWGWDEPQGGGGGGGGGGAPVPGGGALEGHDLVLDVLQAGHEELRRLVVSCRPNLDLP